MSRFKRHSVGRQVRGFTLIEVAVVVAIIAAVMTFGLTFLNAQITSGANNITKTRAGLIKDALIAHLGANRRLPCPIVPTGGMVTGYEATPLPATCPSTFGVIPYATLGLSRDVAEDGWGNLFSYQVHAEAVPVCPGTGVNWANATCFGEGKGAGLVVNDGTLAAPVPIASSVMAVVLSHGPNGLSAYVVEGTRNANPTTCEEARNAHVAIAATPACPGLPTAGTYAYFKGETAENDDLVTYLTVQEAIQSLVKQGTLRSAQARVVEDLQTLTDRALVAKVSAVWAAPPSSPNPPTQCTSSVGVTLPRDPWGNTYGLDDFSLPTPAGFPICLYSTGGTGLAPTRTATACTCTAPTICRTVGVQEFNAYLAKAGFPLCP